MSNHTSSRRLRAGVIIAAAAFALAGVAACGAGGDSNSAGSSVADAPARQSAPEVAGLNSTLSVRSADDTADARTPAAKDDPVIRRQVISTGDITLVSTDVARTRADIMAAVKRWDGTVADEETSADKHGHVRRVYLTLRVPSVRFEDAMSGVAGLAHATHQTRSAKDVTTKVIDTNARVRAKERAVAQLERLLDRADTLGQVIRLEGDISERQSELDSLKHQQAYLRDQTSMSTITVDISREDAAGATTRDAGLLRGFSAGWHAFQVTAVATLTAIGAVAPFATLVAVIGIPVWLVRRRRGFQAHAEARSSTTE